MKIATYRLGGRESFGIVAGGGVIDVGRALAAAGIGSLRAALAAGALGRVADAAAGRVPDAGLDEIEFLPVIPDPGKILCVGLNYESHRIETGNPQMAHPTLFIRFADTLVGHRQPVLRPAESGRLDYEGELAVIMGRGGRRIAAGRALEHVAGYTCFQDASVRDWQGHTTQYTPGKNFAATGGFGPWLATPEEVPPWDAVTVLTRLNGTEMQRGNLDDLIFGIPALIEYVSTFTALAPGDVISTGTPGGVGYARRPPVYLAPGDAIEVEITGIGVLANPVAAG